MIASHRVLATALALLGAVLLSACAAIPPPSPALAPAPTRADTGRFIEWENIQVAGLPDQRVTIWLPPGYDVSQQRYPVLYMHDGKNLFDPALSNFNKVWAADEAVMGLAAQGRIQPHIIVGIWQPGEDRYRQYLPQPVAEAATGPLAASIAELSMGKPVVSATYLGWIADTLKPHVDAVLRTRTGPQDTAIVGSSMGGIMSCYAITARPDVFGRAGCVSSHWPIALLPENLEQVDPQAVALWQEYFAANLGPPAGRRIWMDHGTATLDAFYPPYQRAIDASFRAAGWREGTDFRSKSYEGAEHEENAWAARLPEMLEWLLRPA